MKHGGSEDAVLKNNLEVTRANVDRIESKYWDRDSDGNLVAKAGVTFTEEENQILK